MAGNNDPAAIPSTTFGGFRHYITLPVIQSVDPSKIMLVAELNVRVRRKHFLFNRDSGWCRTTVAMSPVGSLYVYMKGCKGYWLSIAAAKSVTFSGVRDTPAGVDVYRYAAIIKLVFPFGDLILQFDSTQHIKRWRNAILSFHQAIKVDENKETLLSRNTAPVAAPLPFQRAQPTQISQQSSETSVELGEEDDSSSTRSTSAASNYSQLSAVSERSAAKESDRSSVYGKEKGSVCGDDDNNLDATLTDATDVDCQRRVALDTIEEENTSELTSIPEKQTRCKRSVSDASTMTTMSTAAQTEAPNRATASCSTQSTFSCRTAVIALPPPPPRTIPPPPPPRQPEPTPHVSQVPQAAQKPYLPPLSGFKLSVVPTMPPPPAPAPIVVEDAETIFEAPQNPDTCATAESSCSSLFQCRSRNLSHVSFPYIDESYDDERCTRVTTPTAFPRLTTTQRVTTPLVIGCQEPENSLPQPVFSLFDPVVSSSSAGGQSWNPRMPAARQQVSIPPIFSTSVTEAPQQPQRSTGSPTTHSSSSGRAIEQNPAFAFWQNRQNASERPVIILPKSIRRGIVSDRRAALLQQTSGGPAKTEDQPVQ